MISDRQFRSDSGLSEQQCTAELAATGISSYEVGSVAIAMRQQLDVELLRAQLLLTKTLNVVLATFDIQEVVEFCEKKPVSLAILDFGFSNRAAYMIGSELLAARRTRRLLLLDRYYNPLRAELALAIPAGYCSRSISLCNFIKYTELLAYDRPIGPAQLAKLVDHERQRRVDCAETSELTKRQIQVWTLIGEGLSVADCAEQLGIAESTADNHKSNLMKKLDVKKSIELARRAFQAGLVDI